MGKFKLNKETIGKIGKSTVSSYKKAKNGSLLTDLIFPVKPKDEKEEIPPSYKEFNQDILAFFQNSRNFIPDRVSKYDSGQSNWIGNESGKKVENVGTRGCGWLAEDPTVLGFQLKFSEQDPLFYLRNQKEEDGIPSAAEYLLRLGQEDRYNLLRRFQKKIKYLFQTRDYYMQRLNGLGNIYEHREGVSYIEREIKIDTLESIDLFVSSIADDYNKATYDYDNMKSVIPINLLYFDLVIVVNEIRQFKTFLQGLQGDDLTLDYDQDQMSYLNHHLGCFVMKFSDCLFDFTESNGYLNSLDNTAPNPIANSFKIKLGKLDFSEYDLEPFSELTNLHYEQGTLEIPYDKATLGNLKRFTREQVQKKKSFLGKLFSGDWKGVMEDAKKEGIKIGREYAEIMDRKIQNTVGLAESKVLNAAGQIIQKWNPVNLVSRVILHGQNINGTHVWRMDKWESQFNRKLSDTVDDITDTIMLRKKNKTNASAISGGTNLHVRNNDTRREHKEWTRSSDQFKGAEDRFPTMSNPKSQKEQSEKLRKDICRMIIYGKTEEEYLSDVIRSTIGKKGIN